MDDNIELPAIRELNIRTIDALHKAELLQNRSHSDYQSMANDWLFPLFPIHLSPDQVNPEELRAAQRN